MGCYECLFRPCRGGPMSSPIDPPCYGDGKSLFFNAQSYLIANQKLKRLPA